MKRSELNTLLPYYIGKDMTLVSLYVMMVNTLKRFDFYDMAMVS